MRLERSYAVLTSVIGSASQAVPLPPSPLLSMVTQDVTVAREEPCSTNLCDWQC